MVRVVSACWPIGRTLRGNTGGQRAAAHIREVRACVARLSVLHRFMNVVTSVQGFSLGLVRDELAG